MKCSTSARSEHDQKIRPERVAAETLAYRLGSRMRVASISLLHDIPVRPNNTALEQMGDPDAVNENYFAFITKFWRVRDQFGAKEADKLFYWHNQDYVTVTPENCYTTLLHRPGKGTLAFVSNLNPGAKAVTVQFNLEALELKQKPLEAINALTDEPVEMADEGNVSVSLGSEKWRYLWLRPAE